MPRYGYSTRQSGPPPRDHITEYRPAICRGNAMGNTNLWRFFTLPGAAKLYKYGWEIPVFSPVGGTNEAAHILSSWEAGRRYGAQTRRNEHFSKPKEVSNMAVSALRNPRLHGDVQPPTGEKRRCMTGGGGAPRPLPPAGWVGLYQGGPGGDPRRWWGG